jgi:hypothetical protein
MNIKTIVLFLAGMLTLSHNELFADNYYYDSNMPVNNFPLIEVPVYPYATYSTYSIPTIRYEWVPVYTYKLVRPSTNVFCFPSLQQPKYQMVTEWQFRPVIRY